MPTPIEHGELTARLQAGTIVLLDAQAPGWFEQEHLPGAIRLDWDHVAECARNAIPDIDTAIAVYCWNTTCSGSVIAAGQLEQLGYSNVRRYIGGKQDWVNRGSTLEGTGTA